MFVRRLALAIALFLLAPICAFAQDFGVAESAETINRGNFKFTVNPILIFHDSDNDGGAAFKFGYGFTRRFDMEAKAAVYDGVNFFGGDAEFWLVKGAGVDVSATGGLHIARGDLR